MKGIIAAGGSGTRLYPSTKVTPKSLLPIYDKPMIYYPLSIMILCGIREVLFICSSESTSRFVELLGDGKDLGMEFTYISQESPRGIAEMFILGESFIEDDKVCLILGDTVMFGDRLSDYLMKAINQPAGANVFGYHTANPTEFGSVGFDDAGRVQFIEEKTQEPNSNIIVPGLYFYDNSVVDIAKNIKPSHRGELEITTINNHYINLGLLHIEIFGDGIVCIDTGKPEYVYAASNLVKIIQENKGQYIACIEEQAYLRGFIDNNQLFMIGKEYEHTNYGNYILRLAQKSKRSYGIVTQ